MRSAVAVFVLAASISSAAVAQAPSVAVGARVRVTAPSQNLTKHVASVVAIRGDTLDLVSADGMRAVPLIGVTRLEVSTGSRARVLRNAGLGLGAGFALGAILGAVTYEEPDLFVAGPAEAAAFAGVGMGAIGLVVGSVIGIFDRVDRWENRPVRVGVSVQPARSGIALSLSRAF